jgi:hypothetical protein
MLVDAVEHRQRFLRRSGVQLLKGRHGTHSARIATRAL